MSAPFTPEEGPGDGSEPAAGLGPEGPGGGVTPGWSFDEAFRRFYERVRTHAEGRLGDPGLAEDVVQETFLELFDYRHRIDHLRSPRPLLFTIGTHTEKRLLGKWREPGTFYGQQPPPPEATPEDAYLTREQLEQILQGLNPRDRQALIDRAYGASYFEIADKLGVSRDVVNKLLSRARLAAKALRKLPGPKES